MTWHKQTQSFSSSDNFFKILWNNALSDEVHKLKFKNQSHSMRQFKFDNDIKALVFLVYLLVLDGKRSKRSLKNLLKNFTLI